MLFLIFIIKLTIQYLPNLLTYVVFFATIVEISKREIQNMRISDAIIKCLEKENVKYLFGYPGGAILPIYESLRQSHIKHILVRHEQSAAHCASGYARSSKNVGVCIATSGPGATNLITAIATAYADSIPLVIITGQVNSDSIGKDVFQEADIIGATEPFTKHNYLVKKGHNIPKIIKEAFYIAKTGRPGPVLIDIPVDIQNDNIEFKYPQRADVLGYKPIYNGHSGQIKRALTKIHNSKKPLICAGGGIICSDSINEFRSFVNTSKIPVIHTLMGTGALNEDSKYYIGMIGTHGDKHCEGVIAQSDLILIIGARIADRAHNFIKSLNNNVDIIHIDVDPAEVGKNIQSHIPIVGDAKKVLEQLNSKLKHFNEHIWVNPLDNLKSNIDYLIEEHYLNPKKALEDLSILCDDNCIITADVGQNQIWTIKNFEFKGHRALFTSGGLGTMGYSLPASIGAFFGSNKKVISISGDGGIQMSLAELGTISQNSIPILIIIFNNNRLGMVRELQYTHYGKDHYYAVNMLSPDFVALGKSYGIDGKKIYSNEDFKNILHEVINHDKPYIIECMVNPDFATL